MKTPPIHPPIRIVKRAVLVLVALGVGVAACHGGDGPKGSGTGASGGGGSGGLDSASGCFGREWIGRADQVGACPEATAPWLGGAMFQGLPSDASKALGRYCYYELPDDVAFDLPLLASLPVGPNQQPPLEWLECDTEVVAPMLSTADVAAAMSDDLADAARIAFDVPAALSPNPGAVPVHLAVIDTWPNAGGVSRSPHGFGMGSLAGDLTCGLFGVTPCPVDVAPYLALNVVEPGERDNTLGGYYGLRGRVARAVVQAVTEWDALNDDSRLIVNLSIGWDGQYNTTPAGDPSIAADAVRDALELGACHGALGIAAAGNASGGPSPEVGPLYPAAWEGTAPYCDDDISLVYAAGSVDGRDELLPTARQGAMPPHVVPSLAIPAVGKAKGAPQPKLLGPFTGTSIAAAATSAVAALLWHYDATPSPHALITAIRGTGVSLAPLGNDFGVDPAGTPVRRLSLCLAVSAKVPGLACAAPSAYGGVNPAWTTAELDDALLNTTSSFDGSALTALDTSTPCSADVYVDATLNKFAGSHPCPSEQLPAAAIVPWVTPQPGIDPCGACALSVGDPANAVLELGVNEELTEAAHPETLALWSGGILLERYELGSATDGTSELRDGVLPGKVYKIVLPVDPTSAVAADLCTIEWLPTSRDSQTTSQVVLVQ